MKNEKMCLRKKVFWTPYSATSAALRHTEENRKSGKGPRMRAYRCPNCLQWHLASVKA